MICSEPLEHTHGSPYESVGVVGGGAVGITAAETLARRGADVTLYEQGQLADGSTGRAAGLCYDAFADERDARHAARSLERFRELGVLTEVPYVWFVQEGHDNVTRALREQVRRMQRNDRAVTLLSPAELAARFPALRTDDIACAAVARNAGYVDTVAYVDRVAARVREAGATVRTGTPIRLTVGPGVETQERTVEHDAVLVAAGAHTASLLDAAGWHGHGFMRAPALGERVAETICGGDGVPAFDPGRFDGTEAVDVPGGIVD
ncbi:MAG: FAD-dependent oxidoreductase [Halovenus sp.]